MPSGEHYFLYISNYSFNCLFIEVNGNVYAVELNTVIDIYGDTAFIRTESGLTESIDMMISDTIIIMDDEIIVNKL
jgi:TPP-dependent trihydroxycyclohexane-1,2-dione (THcHDO) dehydratase